jgi:hypothetical protein
VDGLGPLCARVAALCDATLARLTDAGAGDGAVAGELRAVRDRLGEPLRIAVAGRVKAGKSTLVNALLGRAAAPTAVGECTRVPAWFTYGYPERAELRLRDGSVRPLALTADGALPETLGAPVEDVAAVHVHLSVERLRDVTIIDTPGLASANDELSAATRALLADRTTGAAAEADALVYVMAQDARADDVEVLAAFRPPGHHGDAVAMGAVGVLNKADRIASGSDRLDEARAVAGQQARRLEAHLTGVVPLVALWAETAVVELRGEDVAHLASLASADARTRTLMLLSADRFRAAEVDVPLAARERLLAVLDLFGIEQCLRCLEDGVADAVRLERRLRELSGIDALEEHVARTLSGRADLLKADRALKRLEAVAWRRAEGPEAAALPGLRDALDEVAFDPAMHALDEARALQAVLSSRVTLPAALADEVRRVALEGGAGGGALPADAQERARVALEGVDRWQAFVNGPGTGTDEVWVGTVMRRSWERVAREAARS